ncbi:MAG: hypothetical protein QXV82_09355 [Ignisphaera sp.]
MALSDKMIRKYAENVEGKGKVWLREVKQTPVNPMELAAVQNAVRIAKLKQVEELWASIMKSLKREYWVKFCESAGEDAYNIGVKAKVDKQKNFATKFAPVLEEASTKAKAMPGDTLDKRLARVKAVVEHLIANKGKWKLS